MYSLINAIRYIHLMWKLFFGDNYEIIQLIYTITDSYTGVKQSVSILRFK